MPTSPSPGPADTAGRQAALAEALALAVPAWIGVLREAGAAARAMARSAAEAVMAAADLAALDPHGDQSWDTDLAFDALARSLALDAYRPGGVTYLGAHWEATRAAALDASTTVTAQGDVL